MAYLFLAIVGVMISSPATAERDCSFVTRTTLPSSSSCQEKDAPGTVLSAGLRNNDSHSLSHWLASPETYAERLGMAVKEVKKTKEAHRAASQALNDRLSSLSDGNLKHQLICQHRHRYPKHPFVCQNCWCYLPICLCKEAAKNPKLVLPKSVQQVVLWTHHREWTSISNSGSLLPLVLGDTRLLMKGFPDHDEDIQKIFNDRNSTIVALWPDNDKTHKMESSYQRINWLALQTRLVDRAAEAPITLLALEGTWRTARRMASKLPDHVVRAALPPEVSFWNNPVDDDNPVSLLQPLRQQEGGSKDNICTAEAVTAALVGLGLSKDDGRIILDLVEQKVSLTRQYQGKRKRDG